MQTTGYTESPIQSPRAEFGMQAGGRPQGSYGLSPGEAAMQFFSDYAHQRPEVVAMWAFGVGFVLGWKLKPW